jgi:hypothetical protein
MMKLVALVVVAALAAAVSLAPAPVPPTADEPATPQPAPFAVCPAGEAATRQTVLDVAGDGPGTADVSIFSASEIEVEKQIEIPDSGAVSLVVNDLTGIDRAPLLVGLPDASAAVETVLSGDGQAALSCDAGSGDPVAVPGGTTKEGDTFVLMLANPFAGPATVDIGAASEVGTETNSSLEGIVVPPRSLIPADLGAVLPGRQMLSAWVTPVSGRVVAAAVQGSSDDVGALQGHVPGLDWYMPVLPLDGVTTRLVLVNPGLSDVPFQLDVYGGSQGMYEDAYEDTVPARGQISVDTADLLDGPGGVRVLAAGAVGAALRLEGDGVRALVPGAAAPGPVWVLPGAGRLGPTSLLVLNPGDVDVSAQVTTADGSQTVTTVDVPAGTMTRVDFPADDVGARVEADGDVIVSWMTRSDAGLAGDSGRVPPP